MGKILPMIKPYLYQNGGPIITVQVKLEVLFLQRYASLGNNSLLLLFWLIGGERIWQLLRL